MRRSAWLLLVAVGIGSPRPAPATEPIERLLLEAATPEELRANLLAHAAALPDSARAEKGEAYNHAGLSYERDGLADSAIACYQRAFNLRGQPDERDALVDALLLRNATGDPARALGLLRSPVVENEVSTL